MLDATSATAWVQAMLDVEAALARAEARVGMVPREAADAIAAACDSGRFDVARLGEASVAGGNPVIPLVRALTELVPEPAAGWVHWGATSQDVLDTATMLITRNALELLEDDLDRLAAACAATVERHRSTVMAGRTLLQQALPITFGLKVAGWLVAVLDARDGLYQLRTRRLAIQLGGAAGTLAAFDGKGLAVAEALAAELRLAMPVLPWHAARGRVGELAGALGVAGGTVGKLAEDVLLLAQTEVGEASEGAAPGRGGSSTLPHKRNPVAAVAVRSCVRGVHAQIGLLQAAMAQEHERAAGAWQAEWGALAEAFRLDAGAVRRSAGMVEGLDVHPARMRENLELNGGLLLSEHVMMVLAGRVGRGRAHELVGAAVERAARSGLSLREELLADATVAANLSRGELDAALRPESYLGETDALIDRALADYRARRVHAQFMNRT